MEKRFVAKTQKILPKIPQYTSLFSNIITSAPEDEEILKRKGTVYGVFEVSGPIEFETSVISKTISDILQDSYFQSDNISPVQSLEKAILDTKEKLTKLNENTLREKSSDLKLDIVAAVLWGNVLYIVQHGKGNAFIMREGETKPVSFLTEGNFSSASGIVKNDDVVVMNTVSFGSKYPPSVLLRTNNETFQDLPPESSCLMIKFSVDSTFTTDEQIDFGLKKKKTSPIDLKELRNKLTQKNPKKEERKGAEGIMSIRGGRDKAGLGNIRKLLIPIFLLGFVASIGYTIKTGAGRKEQKVEPENTEIKEPTPTVVEVETEMDESFFYDLKITDAEASPTNMVVTQDKVYVSDKASGKLYVSDAETPQFSAIETLYPGIENMVLKDGMVNFQDKDGYKIYNTETGTAEEFMKAENLEITYPYLDFVYEISEDIISKYTGTAEKETWAQSPSIPGTTSMVIDISIYTLNGSGEMSKFTSGTEDTFELKGMDESLSNPTKMVLSSDSSLIYIADNGNKSIAVIDVEGNFKQRITHKDAEKWGDIKDISISTEGNKLFVLNGTSVYEIAL